MQWLEGIVVLSPFWAGIFYVKKMIIFLLFCFFMQLAIRPSMREKTVSYFLAYLPRILLFTLCIAVPVELVKSLTDFLCHGNAFLLIGKHAMYLFLNPVYFFPVPSPMFLYVGYFIFDGDGSFSNLIAAVMKGWKMAIYTYPFCLLSMGVMAGAGWLGASLLGWHYWAFLALCGSWIYYLWLGCWFDTMYIKKAHEDFSLY